MKAAVPIRDIEIAIRIMQMINQQKYDLAKFFRLTFRVPPKENTMIRIRPTSGIANKKE